MRSKLNKVMHKVAGLPMVGHVLNALKEAGCRSPIVVLSPARPEVEAFARAFMPDVNIAHQEQQLGTGHAVMTALSHLVDENCPVLIVFADTPLIRPETMAHVIELFTTRQLDVMALAMQLEDGGAYGRLVLDDSGNLQRIVEARDASQEELRINLCNSGMMVVRSSVLRALLPKLNNANTQGEYYLPDLIALACVSSYKVGHHLIDEAEVMGVNNRLDLAAVEAAFQERARHQAMLAGVTLIAPETIFFSYDTDLAADVCVHPHVVFGPGVKVAGDAEILSYSHLEGCDIASGARVGPFARIRPETMIDEGAHIGNFVEVKKSHVGRGAKINHLSYIGDAELGAKTNIGAGTITCNYDGFVKSKTHIGEGVFVGSNTALVAPLTVGEGAIIGAGSVITQDINPDSMVVVRAERRDVNGGAKRFRQRKLSHKQD